MGHIADGRPSLASSQAVAACEACGRAFVVRVELLAAGTVPRIEPPAERHDPIGPLHPVIDLIMAAEDEERRKVPA